MRYSNSITFVLAAFILRYTDAWIMDSSCRSDNKNSTNYESTIENGMREAFIYNKAALDALDALESMGNKSTADHATSVAQHDLFQYLFSVAMKDGKVDPSYHKFKKVKSAFQAVKRFEKESDGFSHPLDLPDPFPELIVYCDWARFDEGVNCAGKPDPNVACDRDLRQDVAMGPLYNGCKNGQQHAAPITFTHHGGNAVLAQIQMCSEYLKQSHTHPLKFWKDISLKALLAKPQAVMKTVLNAANPIDIAAASISHTFFHDMIHAVGGGEIVDVHVDETGPDGVAEGEPKDQASYGWRNCLRFSPYGPSRENMDKARALDNADNYAYFGLGASLISPVGSGQPQRVNPDGSLQVIPMGKQSRGDVQVRALAMKVVRRGEEEAASGASSKKPSPSSTTPASSPSPPTSTKPATSPLSTTKTKPASSPFSTTTHTSPTPSKSADAVITPRYDFQDLYGNYDFLNTAQSVLSALEAIQEAPVTGMNPTPSATFTTPKSSTATHATSPSTKKTSTHTTTKKRSTATGQATTTKPGLWCAPTGAASAEVPIEDVRINITDFCALKGDTVYGAARYNLPVPDSPIRSYSHDYDYSNFTLRLDISLLTGEFDIKKDVCSDTMHEILDDCDTAKHLLKFGGGIPVKGPSGTANFNISVVHDGTNN